MSRMRLCLLALGLTTAPLQAQSEAALRDYFEGKTVVLKIAMPGTENGVDVYPGTDKPLDYPRYASRLKDYGTAIRAGQPAMVTKIRLKSKHIEFQLDGGGYGTMSDETSTNVSVSSAPKTKREQNLEGELKRETDPAKKREIKEELDGLRKEREREDVRNRAAVAEAEEHRKENLRQRQIEGGSRFNVRFRDRLPDTALTPEGLKAALAAYVKFGTEDQGAGAAAAPAAAPLTPAMPEAPSGLPRKGMLLREADALLGAPKRASERAEGRLKVTTRVYDTQAGQITAEFVEGVLFRYSVTSN